MYRLNQEQQSWHLVSDTRQELAAVAEKLLSNTVPVLENASASHATTSSMLPMDSRFAFMRRGPTRSPNAPHKGVTAEARSLAAFITDELLPRLQEDEERIVRAAQRTARESARLGVRGIDTGNIMMERPRRAAAAKAKYTFDSGDEEEQDVEEENEQEDNGSDENDEDEASFDESAGAILCMLVLDICLLTHDFARSISLSCTLSSVT
jgi:hypothetical protein